MAKKADAGIKIVASNRKARHDYTIEDTVEAGIVLIGSEIKSIRAGQVNLRDSYAAVENDEVWLYNTHIAPYDPASYQGHEPRRRRKLLLHKRQIARLASQVHEKGYTLVPLSMYLRDNRAKIELALARGKHQYDKRADIAKREDQRRAERAVREYQRSGRNE